jgi:hypothetical protein
MSIILCASQTTESARSIPATSDRCSGANTAEAPWAPSTWNQRSPAASQKSATASSGSYAPVAVDPALATTAIARRPARSAARRAPASAPGRSR